LLASEWKARKDYLCRMSLGLYDQLENMGCGLKELTILRDTILEISRINGMEPNFAIKKFYKDIEDQYEAKLGFEMKIENMKKSLSDAR
jgi:hypothetical protein